MFVQENSHKFLISKKILCKRFFYIVLFLAVFIPLNGYTTNLEKYIFKENSFKERSNFFRKKVIWKVFIKNNHDKNSSSLHFGYSNNNIFFANKYGIVKSIDINNGKEIWKQNLSIKSNKFPFYKKSAQLSGGIIFHRNYIYIGSELDQLYSLQSNNGNIVWKTTVSGEILSDPVVTNKLVLIHSNIGMLHAINKNNGNIKWITSLGINPIISLRGESKPVIISNHIIIGDKNGFINILEINSGKIIWKKYIIKNKNHDGSILINDIQSSIIIKNNTAYVLSYSDNFSAIDLLSKKELWHKKLGSTKDFLITNRKNIYIVDNIDRIYSINAKNGKIIWSQNLLLHKHLTSPSIYNGYIVLGDCNGNLYWIDSNNGLIVFKEKISKSGIIFKPIFISNKIIIQTKSGEIYALE